MPDSKLHSLPNGRSRGDLTPAQLPDPPRPPALCRGALRCSGLPHSATAQHGRHQNGLTRLEGKGSRSYSHSLLFVFNGKWQLHHCIPQVPGSRGCAGTAGCRAAWVPPQLRLCRASHSTAMESMRHQPSALTPRLFCWVPDFLIYFLLLPSLLKKRWRGIRYIRAHFWRSK